MWRSSVLAASLFCVATATASAQPGPTNPPALTYTQPLAPKSVELVQQRLRQEGAYRGRVDGVWGADSQAALERYQQGHSLQVTGGLNQATIASLGIAPEQLFASGQAVPQSNNAQLQGATLSRNSVAQVQSRLHELNFYNGPTDGIWGGETQQAIERFQQGRGLQPNGQLNTATLAALGLNQLVQSP